MQGRSMQENHSQSLIVNSSPTMFDSASNVMISGGHFTASHGNHANVTININGM